MKLAAKVEPNATKLQMLADMGWKFLEIYTNRKIVQSSEDLSLLKKYQKKFEYVVHAPTDIINEDVIDFAYSIKARLINTHKIIDNTTLTRLVKYAKKKHITITIENEAFPESHHLDKQGKQLPTIKTYDPIRSGGDFIRLQQEVPDVRLCVDAEHAAIRQEYPSILSSCSEFVRHIHMCGYQGKEHHRPVYENLSLMQSVITLLIKYEYTGFIVCEHDTKFHTFEVWKKTLDDCKPLFGSDCQIKRAKHTSSRRTR